MLACVEEMPRQKRAREFRAASKGSVPPPSVCPHFYRVGARMCKVHFALHCLSQGEHARRGNIGSSQRVPHSPCRRKKVKPFKLVINALMMPQCLVNYSTGDSTRFRPRRTAKRSDEARRVALREKKSESSPLQGGTMTPRGYCWGRHLWPSTEGPRTVGARAKIIRRPSLLGRATSRSPQARTSCEAMRRPEPVSEDT